MRRGRCRDWLFDGNGGEANDGFSRLRNGDFFSGQSSGDQAEKLSLRPMDVDFYELSISLAIC